MIFNCDDNAYINNLKTPKKKLNNPKYKRIN